MKIGLRALSGVKNISTEDYLQASLEIYAWLESNSLKGEHGKFYRVNPGGLIDYSSHPVHGKYAMYSGSSGIGFFLIRLYETTGDEKYLDEVEEIVDELIPNVAGKEFYEEKLVSAPESELKVTGWHTGIYSGPSGAGLLALVLHKYRPDARYVAFARKLGEDIIQVSRKTQQGLTLTEDLDIFSDGGFVLYFISLYQVTQDDRYLEYAREYARFIYAQHQEGQYGGHYYYANELSLVGMPVGSIYPGFAHGTAGIGYLFAVLFEADHQQWEFDAAKEVAVFLESIADKVGDGVLIPYIYGGEDSVAYTGKYYLGFCHGPAGTAFLYQKLYQLTGEESYKQFIISLARGVIHAGAPEYNSWGLWNSYCLCCGTPGLIEFFVEVYELTGDTVFLEYAKRSAAKTIADSTETGSGRAFYGHWDRTNHRDIQSYTGFYSGAAGVGANLLRLYAHEKGIDVTRGRG